MGRETRTVKANICPWIVLKARLEDRQLFSTDKRSVNRTKEHRLLLSAIVDPLRMNFLISKKVWIAESKNSRVESLAFGTTQGNKDYWNSIMVYAVKKKQVHYPCSNI